MGLAELAIRPAQERLSDSHTVPPPVQQQRTEGTAFIAAARLIVLCRSGLHGESAQQTVAKVGIWFINDNL